MVNKMGPGTLKTYTYRRDVAELPPLGFGEQLLPTALLLLWVATTDTCTQHDQSC